MHYMANVSIYSYTLFIYACIPGYMHVAIDIEYSNIYIYYAATYMYVSTYDKLTLMLWTTIYSNHVTMFMHYVNACNYGYWNYAPHS